MQRHRAQRALLELAGVNALIVGLDGEQVRQGLGQAPAAVGAAQAAGTLASRVHCPHPTGEPGKDSLADGLVQLVAQAAAQLVEDEVEVVQPLERPGLRQERAVERDLVDAVDNVPGGLGLGVDVDRVDLDDQDIADIGVDARSARLPGCRYNRRPTSAGP